MLSILQIAQLYLSGITVVFFLAFFSLLLCNYVGETQRKMLPVFGFVTLGFLTAVWFTRGNTALWPAFILVSIGLWYGRKCAGVCTTKTLIEFAYLISLYTVFFILMLTLVFNNAGNLVVSNYDTPFYVRLVEYLLSTGNESYYMERLYPEEVGVWPYHYLEHWVAALLKILTPNIPTIFSFDLVLNPLLFSLSTLGFFHLIRATTKNTGIVVYFLAPMIVFGIAIPEIVDLFPNSIPFNLNRSWSPIEQPKAAVVYMFLSPILLAVHTRNISLIWVMSMLLGVCFIPTIPAITFSAILLTVWLVMVGEINWRKALRISTLVILVASVGLGGWLGYNSQAESVGHHTSIDVIITFYQHHVAGVLGLTVISSFIIFLPALFLLTEIRRVNMEITFFVLLLYVSGILAYAALGFEFQSFQLFQTISIPAATCLFLLLAVAVMNTKNRLWFKILVFALLFHTAFTRITRYGFVLASSEEIADLSSFVKETDVRTAFIKNPNEYLGALSGKNPYLYFPIEQLHATSSTYHSFSLNELSWHVESELYEDEYRYKRFSDFCKFVEHEGLQDAPIEAQQKAFLVKNNIHYLEASAMADISALNLTIIDSLVFKNGSRLYKF